MNAKRKIKLATNQDYLPTSRTPKINMSPEKGPFQKENSLPTIIFQGESLLVFGGGIYKHVPLKGKLYFDISKLVSLLR